MLLPTMVAVVVFWVLPLAIMFSMRTKHVAVCNLHPEGKSSAPVAASLEGKGWAASRTTPVVGCVTLAQVDTDAVSIKYHITGLTPGRHRFHIHEKADFSEGKSTRQAVALSPSHPQTVRPRCNG